MKGAIMATAKEIEAKKLEDARNALAYSQTQDTRIELSDENHNAFKLILSDEQELPSVEEQEVLEAREKDLNPK